MMATLDIDQMTTAERVHYGISKGDHEAAQVKVLDDALSAQIHFNQSGSGSMPRLTLPIWASLIICLGFIYVL